MFVIATYLFYGVTLFLWLRLLSSFRHLKVKGNSRLDIDYSILTIKLFIGYILLILATEIVMLISSGSNYIFLISHALLLIYELIIVAQIGLIYLKKTPILLISLILSIFIIVTGSVLSLLLKSFQPLNIVDYTISIIKIILCQIFMIRAIKFGRSEELLVGMIVIIGLMVYFTEQLFITCVLLHGFIDNYEFTNYMTIASIGIWLGGVIWIRRLS